MTAPNILLIMTDEERYPPPYELDALAEFRRTRLPARHRLRTEGLELHRHYGGSTACAPSRTTLFTGQFPSLHGVTQTDGLAKKRTDAAMGWLDPDTGHRRGGGGLPARRPARSVRVLGLDRPRAPRGGPL